VQETRLGLHIEVLSDNNQELQVQLDEHVNRFGAIDVRMERIELSFASMQALLEERLPPRQQAPLVQPKPQVGAQLGQGGGMQNVGEKTPIVEQVEPIPIDAEARNTIPRRPPTHEVFRNLNQPR
jgi:hypothetical protein